jgi:hypothetical protein
MRLKAFLDFVVGTAGAKPAAVPCHDDRVSHPTSQDRLGFCALHAAALMDRLGFLYAPLKSDPSRSRPAERSSPPVRFPHNA